MENDSDLLYLEVVVNEEECMIIDLINLQVMEHLLRPKSESSVLGRRKLDFN